MRIQITNDIAAEKHTMKELISQHRTQHKTQGAEEVRAVLAKRLTLAKAQTQTMDRGEDTANEKSMEGKDMGKENAWALATEIAPMRRMTRQATKRSAAAAVTDAKGGVGFEREETSNGV